jgi:DNA polymerase III gamma/tau subunit
VRRIEEEGWDPRHVYGQFLSFCRDALHLGLGGDPEQIDLPAEEAHALAATARAAGYENLLRLLHQLLSSEQTVRRSETGVLALEIAWLRAAELPKLTRVEELLGGALPATPDGARFAPRPAASAPPPAPRPVSAPVPPPAPQIARAEPAPRAAAPAAPTAGDPIQAFREAVSLRKPAFAALLSEATIDLVDGELRIEIPTGDSMLESRLQQGAYRQVVDEAVAAVWGSGFVWRTARGAARKKIETPVETPAADRGRVADNPQVQAVLDIFGGKVETVEEHGSSREDQP